MNTRSGFGIVPLVVMSLALLIQSPRDIAGMQTSPGFDLRRLTPLVDGRLSPEEAARLLLSFLHEEIAAPSPVRQGIGGGPITHDYILAQLVLAAENANASREILVRAVAGTEPGEYQDAIRLSLGLLGDPNVVPFLIGYLANANHSPFLRERAARGLGRNPDPRAIPVLAAALTDPFYEITHIGPLKVYSIRIAARGALLRTQEATLSGKRITLPAEVQQALDRVVTSEEIPRASK